MAIRSAQAQAFTPLRGGSMFSSFAFGALSLDDKKLRWKRHWFNVPFFGLRSVEIDIEDIRQCRTTGLVASIIATGGLEFSAEGKKYVFAISGTFGYSKQKCEEWRVAIIKAILEGRAAAGDAN